ncbi:unnamed protein product, partial [Effrenium voratum]
FPFLGQWICVARPFLGLFFCSSHPTGGLERLFSRVSKRPPRLRCAPGRGSWTADFNRVLAAGEEDVARAALRQGGVDRVAYKQNRACIFVSHRYHASEAFDFPDEQNPRVNLTLLFGDRSPAQDRRR